MNPPVLIVKDLSTRFETEYESVKALEDISFTLDAGETLAIVGESGSGKSVTALSIMQLLPPSAVLDSKTSILYYPADGKVMELTRPIGSGQLNYRGLEIGMIFQEPMTSLNPLMRCGQQVAETLELHLGLNNKDSRKRTLELFREVKLRDPESVYLKYPHEISGGQKQRVMIAIAISCNPRILIADEPTTALDVTVQKSILLLLKELQQKNGMSILFITHDLNLVKHFSDKVLVLYKGEQVEYEKTATIFSNAQHPYTQSLLACRPGKGARVKYLATVAQHVAAAASRDAITVVHTDQFNKEVEGLEQKPVLLETRDLHVWYPGKKNFFGKPLSWFRAVNGVSLKIREGETLGLVGESGCGKTTLGKTIVKLNEISMGQILYKQKDIATFSNSELDAYRREVQIIFQDPYSSLNPRITIGEAIREPMEVHGLERGKNRKLKAIALLEKVGLLPQHYDRYPHEFSGGQRQRISIARALALDARFLICDESVSALDVSVQAQVLNLLVRLRDEFNFTYLFISHDLNVIRHMSHHICVIHEGKIVERNTSEQLMLHPQQEYTRQLIGSLEI